MKNEYDVAVGQVKAIESEVHHAKGSEPCVYLVRLEAEGLSDGSAALNVAVYLKHGDRTLRTWNWYAPETESRAIYAYLTKSLEDTSWSPDFVRPDMVEDYGSLDVSECLEMLRDAYLRGVGTTRDELNHRLEDALVTRDATARAYARALRESMDLRGRLQSQARLASEAMDARARLEGKVTRLESELEDSKAYSEDLVGSAKAREDREKATGGCMVRTSIRIKKQVNLKAEVDLEGDHVWIAYIGLDPNDKPVALVPMANQSVILRAAIGDVWTEVK